MSAIGIAHAYCQDCVPTLVYGKTKAFCGTVIKTPEVRRMPINRKCGACKSAMQKHEREHS